jgi:phosphoglucomutase
MASLIGLRDKFDVVLASDTDHDRHGTEQWTAGLMNLNHYLGRRGSTICSKPAGLARCRFSTGKTLVSSSMIDRVAKSIKRVSQSKRQSNLGRFGRRTLDGLLGFGGGMKAGSLCFRRLRMEQLTVGLILGLLAVRRAATGRDPSERYTSLTERRRARMSGLMLPPARRKKAVPQSSPSKCSYGHATGW